MKKRLIIVIFIHILLLGAVQFIAWPENFLYPFLQFRGLALYRDMFILYPPLYWELLLNFYKIFGLSLESLKLFSILLVIISDLLLWKASGRKLLPVLFYIPLQIYFEGSGVWVDQLLAPIFLASYIFLKQKRFFLVGVFLGMGLLVKQTAAYFVLVAGLFILLKHFSIKNLLTVAAGFLICGIFLALYLLTNQSLDAFIDRTIIYIFTFHTKQSFQTQWPQVRQALVVVLVFAPAVLIGLKKRKIFLVILLVAASLGIFTRYEHFHLQPALPFVAILLAESIFGLAIFGIFALLFGKFFIASFGDEPRFMSSDFRERAQKINSYVSPGERTLFINTWDHYYYLTNTSPQGNFYVPSAPWTLDYGQNQDKLVTALKRSKQKYVFFGKCFYAKNICYRPKKIEKYLLANYSKVDELSDGTGVFEYDPMTAVKKVQTNDR